MEGNNGGLGIGLLGMARNEAEEAEIREHHRRRQEKAERIECALMAICDEITNRLANESGDMTTKDLTETAAMLAGMATAMGALAMYAPPRCI